MTPMAVSSLRGQTLASDYFLSKRTRIHRELADTRTELGTSVCQKAKTPASPSQKDTEVILKGILLTNSGRLRGSKNIILVNDYNILS